MTEPANEKAILTKKLCEGVSEVLRDYAEQYPQSSLSVDDVRDILVKIIDYLDIADVTGFGDWRS